MKPFIYLQFFLLAGVSFCTLAQTNPSDQFRQRAEELSLEGKYSQSLVYYQKAYALVKKNDPVRAANLCNDISSAYYADGYYKTSLRYCQLGLRHIQKRNNVPDSLYFKIYSSIGTMHGALQNRDSAYYYFQWADQVLDRSPTVEKDIPLYVLHHYLHQGRAFWSLHRYHQSIAYFAKAGRLSEKYHLGDELDYIESSLAEGYDLLGQHAEALRYRKQAVRHNFLDSRRRQELHSGVAYTYQRLGQLDSALVWHQLSWKLHLKEPKNSDHYKRQHLRLSVLIGTCYGQMGQLAKAEGYLKQAELYQAKELKNDRWTLCDIFMEQAKLARIKSDFSLADKLAREIFRLSSLSGSIQTTRPSDLIYPHFALGAVHLQASLFLDQYHHSHNISYLDSSYQCYKNLISLNSQTYFEAARDVQERYDLSAQSKDIFKEAIPVAYALYHKRASASFLQEIFVWFEQANTAYLYDVIKDKNWQLSSQPEKFLEQQKLFIAQRASILTKYGGNTSTRQVKKELNELVMNWYRQSERYKKKQVQDDHVQYTAIQQKLDKESAYVSYKWFDNKIFAFVLTRESAALESWNVEDSLLLSNLRNLKMEFNYNPGFGNYTSSEASISCYKLLIEPLKKWVGGKNRLVIARDWQFNFLPFELLETGKKNQDYLIKHYSVSYTYSASMFYQHPFLNPANLKKTFVDKANISMTIAPFVTDQPTDTSKIEKTWSRVSSLGALKEIGGESLWGERATKQQFLKAGFGYHILHLATHAQADDKNPNDSFIQFYPSADSRLYLSEIYALPLYQTRLVILSSCSAGLGQNLSGEGNISLAHAVAQAGCPSVVTTVWEANDQVINYLSVLLHQYLKQGLPIDKAMQRAKLDFFENEQYRKFGHPYYWANLTLIGNNEAVYDPTFQYRWPALAIGCAGLLLFLLLPGWNKIRKNTKSQQV